MNIDLLLSFFGWCSVFSMALFILSALMLFAFRESIINLHSKLSGVDAEALPEIYFNYLGLFKVLIIIFNIVPYLALLTIS